MVKKKQPIKTKMASIKLIVKFNQEWKNQFNIVKKEIEKLSNIEPYIIE